MVLVFRLCSVLQQGQQCWVQQQKSNLLPFLHTSAALCTGALPSGAAHVSPCRLCCRLVSNIYCPLCITPSSCAGASVAASHQLCCLCCRVMTRTCCPRLVPPRRCCLPTWGPPGLSRRPRAANLRSAPTARLPNRLPLTQSTMLTLWRMPPSGLCLGLTLGSRPNVGLSRCLLPVASNCCCWWDVRWCPSMNGAPVDLCALRPPSTSQPVSPVHYLRLAWQSQSALTETLLHLQINQLPAACSVGRASAGATCSISPLLLLQTMLK